MRPVPRFLGLLALIAVLAAGQVEAQPRSSDDLLDRLRARYEATDALRARFTQTVGDASMEGTLTLRGDAYRIEMRDQTLVTDGSTSWVYSEPDAQVLINDVIPDETAFSPADFFTHYPDRFYVAVAGSVTLDGARHDKLTLTPKSPDAFLREVTLFVRSTDALPTRVQIVDGNGTRLAFDLRDVELNPRLPVGIFRFDPPSGTEVVDLRF
jgi:outer membrane lipoprotein-sorting protein